MLDRDRAAVSEALNLIDDRRPDARRAANALLSDIERRAATTTTPRVGITGAPGAGKSTLLDGLVRVLRQREATVGIVAVDPSSQRSGGALLGDRFRVRSRGADPGVYLRSMAARTRLGGLADATWASVLVLAATFDRVFVETVGVGQSEGEVASLVDSLLFVAQPGAGDVLQFMKAGILELPDVFVVNKADMGAEADRTAGELDAGLGLSAASGDGWRRPILLASARDGRGLDEVVAALDEHRAHLDASGAGLERRANARETFALDALARRYGSFGIERLGGEASLRARVRESESAFEAIRTLGLEIEDALRKPH